MLLAAAAAVFLAGQHSTIDQFPNRVVRTLQPTQVAELWISHSGEYAISPERTGPERIFFGLWFNDVDVAVEGTECGPAEQPDFAECERFIIDARGLHRHIDLRPGMKVEDVDNVLFDLMTEISATYPAEPSRW
jgi:hypothetical protein